MKIAKFEIKNFKGIESTSVNLSDEVPGNIVTLIGLNESGKTTILEALSHFFTEDEEAASFVGTFHRKSALQELIPKDRKAAFTGAITIGATVILESEDRAALARFFLETHGLVLDVSSLPKMFPVQRLYRFEDSEHKETNNYWTINFNLKTLRARNYRSYPPTGDTRPVWLSGVNFLRLLIPKIIYFPTFLFDFPERIYLEGEDGSEVNEYYKHVMQDVLDSQGEGLSIQKHVLERVKKHRDEFPTPATFFAHFFGLDEKSQIDLVAQKMSNEMSRVIFGAWSQILGRNISNKRVQVDWLIDSAKDNAPYLQVSIIDGQARYALSERSLGFRWFFSFLLFTQFRKNRKGGSATIFLFDEPAANLHSKAQIKLLESFSRIASEGTYVVYSTHSHYMVDPLSLEKAYIIDNKAINYDDEEEVDAFSVRKTNIEAVKYRHFVALNPSKTTYFQPVLDALEVSFSPLERSGRAVIVEGKFDFHPFLYLRRRVASEPSPEIFPANGAGDVGTLINLFRGWGVDFRILFDDDPAGREGKRRCIEEYLVATDQAVTIGEIASDLKGRAFEALYQSDVDGAAAAFFETKTITKRQYSLFFQELIANKRKLSLPETEKAFVPISNWIDTTFGVKTARKSSGKKVPKAASR